MPATESLLSPPGVAHRWRGRTTRGGRAKWREAIVRPIPGHPPHERSLKESLRRRPLRHFVAVTTDHPAALQDAFSQACGIFPSDAWRRPNLSRSQWQLPLRSSSGAEAGQPQPAPLIVRMSSGRLFLDRVGRHQSPSPLHRLDQTNMTSAGERSKPELPTLLNTGSFYFALTAPSATTASTATTRIFIKPPVYRPSYISRSPPPNQLRR